MAAGAFCVPTEWCLLQTSSEQEGETADSSDTETAAGGVGIDLSPEA